MHHTNKQRGHTLGYYSIALTINTFQPVLIQLSSNLRHYIFLIARCSWQLYEWLWGENVSERAYVGIV